MNNQENNKVDIDAEFTKGIKSSREDILLYQVKKENQRDIDAILQDCLLFMGFSHKDSPLYQGKHKSIIVHVNGRGMSLSYPKSII